MRFATFASMALAVAPALAQYPAPMGFALGTKHADGTCKFTPDYEKDFDAISQASGAKLVRGYAASDCDYASQILPAAKSKGFKVLLGIWADLQETYDKDLKAITDQAGTYKDQIYAVTVGSETLYRRNFTGEQLRDKIHDAKGKLGDIKVGTADSWNLYANGTADPVIQGGVDILLVNAFSYWQGQEINNATGSYFDDLMQAITHIQDVAGPDSSIEIMNGETGWPTDGGSSFQAAQAGTQNAETYYHSAFCGILKYGISAFYFEAFDEPWKPDSLGDGGSYADEKHWGAMNADRSPKFSLQC